MHFLFLTNLLSKYSFPLPVYGLFLRRISKNNCQTGSLGHIFVTTFAKRLKFAQTYRIVYGHSLLLYKTLLYNTLLYNTLLRKFV